MSSSRGSTVVNILGKDYRIACTPDQEEALLNAARLVHERMQGIRSSGKVIGTDRIAVMAALNLAHEVLDQAPPDPVDLGDTQKRLRGLRERVEVALNENSQLEF